MTDQLAGTKVSGPWFEGEQIVTQGFMPGPGAYEADHTGIDVGLPLGSSLFAGVAGTIRDLAGPDGFGTYQVLTPDDRPDERIVLGHESAQLVPSGHVSAGQLVAYSGSTGNSTGPHLHFEDDVAGQPVNPLSRLTGGGTGGPSAGDVLGQIPGPWNLFNLPKDLPKAIPDLGQALGLTAIADSVAGIPRSIGHGIADAAGAGAHNLEVFAQKQIVALVVAIVVLLVLFA